VQVQRQGAVGCGEVHYREAPSLIAECHSAWDEAKQPPKGPDLLHTNKLMAKAGPRAPPRPQRLGGSTLQSRVAD
jgi:hypothetical protein